MILQKNNNINFSNIAVKAIGVKCPEFYNCNFDGGLILDVDLSGAILHNCSFKGTKIKNVNLNKSIIRYSDFTNSKFDGVKLTNSAIKETNFVNSSMSHTYTTDSYFIRCNFNKVNIKYSPFYTVGFSECAGIFIFNMCTEMVIITKLNDDLYNVAVNCCNFLINKKLELSSKKISKELDYYLFNNGLNLSDNYKTLFFKVLDLGKTYLDTEEANVWKQ